MKRISLILLFPIIVSASDVVELVEDIDHSEIHSFMWIELCEERTDKELSLIHIHNNNEYARKSVIVSAQDSIKFPGCSFVGSSLRENIILKGKAKEIVDCVDNPRCSHLKDYPPPHLIKSKK